MVSKSEITAGKVERRSYVIWAKDAWKWLLCFDSGVTGLEPALSTTAAVTQALLHPTLWMQLSIQRLLLGGFCELGLSPGRRVGVRDGTMPSHALQGPHPQGWSACARTWRRRRRTSRFPRGWLRSPMKSLEATPNNARTEAARGVTPTAGVRTGVLRIVHRAPAAYSSLISAPLTE